MVIRKQIALLLTGVFLTITSCNKTDISDITVEVTGIGNTYHLSSCRYIGKNPIAVSLSDAVERGYEPCTDCNPPVCTHTDSTVVAKKYKI